MSLTKSKQVLLYLGLSFSLIFVSVGISNADPVDFTITAEFGCDVDVDPGTNAILTSVTYSPGEGDPELIEGKINLGNVSTAPAPIELDFTVTAASERDCEGDIVSFGPKLYVEEVGTSAFDILADNDCGMGCEPEDYAGGVKHIVNVDPRGGQGFFFNTQDALITFYLM